MSGSRAACVERGSKPQTCRDTWLKYIQGRLDRGRGTVNFPPKEGFVQWISEKIPVSGIYEKKRDLVKNPNQKTNWRIVVNKRNDIELILKWIFPYLKVKKQVATLLLKYLKIHPLGRHLYRRRDAEGKFSPGSILYPEEAEIIEEIRRLNWVSRSKKLPPLNLLERFG